MVLVFVASTDLISFRGGLYYTYGFRSEYCPLFKEILNNDFLHEGVALRDASKFPACRVRELKLALLPTPWANPWPL